MGWSTTSDNGSHVDVYGSSGLLTYKARSGGGIPYCNCQEPSDFDVSIILSNGEGGECRDVEVSSSNDVCDNEWLVTWFTGSSYNKILDEGAKDILVVKNIDECDKVITLNYNRGFLDGYRLYTGATRFSSASYTDCGIPYLITSSTNVSCASKYKKGNTYSGHKIKYKPISETIPSNFLVGSNALTEIYFPARFDGDKFKNTKTISSGAFSANTALSAVTFSVVETIGEKAFSGCTSLSLIDWGCCLNDGYSRTGRQSSLLKTISADAFSNCSSLHYLNLPNSLQTIGERAFYRPTDNYDYTPVTINSSVTSIGKDAFKGISNFRMKWTVNSSISRTNDASFDGSGEVYLYGIPSTTLVEYVKSYFSNINNVTFYVSEEVYNALSDRTNFKKHSEWAHSTDFPYS